MDMLEVQEFHKRKVVSLLDSSGNNPVFAKRLTFKEGNENSLENRSVDVRIAKNLENQSPARPFDKNLESRTSMKNDRKTIRSKHKIE